MSSLLPRSGLAALAVPGHFGASADIPGVVLSERKGLALATVLARKGQEEVVHGRVREMFAIELPTTPRRAAAGATAFVWSGPGHWLGVAEHEKGHHFEAVLRKSLAGLASVSDQSDGRAVIRISGPKARSALAKGLPLDLHPSGFRPGDAAATIAAQIGIHIWQLDDSPAYELAISRSFADSFWHWLMKSSAEYGVSVIDLEQSN